MKQIFWLILTAGYGGLTGFTGAAEKRRYAEAALCFWDGAYLAFLCLSFLPACMGEFSAAAAAGIGILLGLWQEKRRALTVLVFAAVIGCRFFFPSFPILGAALLGGMGLYHASAGILPEQVEIHTALLSGAGFLTGTIFFAGF